MMVRKSLILIGLMISLLQAQQITSTTTGGNWSEGSTWEGGVAPSASNDVVIAGDVVVDANEECASLSINTGTILRSGEGSYYTITINGDLVNAGSIQDNGDTELNLELAGNLDNQGSMENDKIIFNGPGEQTVSMSENGAFIGMEWVAKDSTAAVVLGSSIMLHNCRLDFSYSDELSYLIMPAEADYTLGLVGEACFTDDIHILGNGNTIFLTGGAYLDGSTTLEDMVLTGTVKIQGNGVTFGGNTITISDTLESGSGFYSTLQVNSLLINQGVIQDVASTELYIESTADLENRGIWINDETRLMGETDQTFWVDLDQTLTTSLELYAMVGTDNYQWYQDGNLLADEDNEILILSNLSEAQFGTYTCISDGVNSRNIMINSTTDPPLSGTFVAQTLLNPGTGNPWTATAADLDADGDMDVAVAFSATDKISWYEQSTMGIFDEHVVTANTDGAQDVAVADLNQDGYLDLVSASVNDNRIAWYAGDGNGNFSMHTISTEAIYARAVHTTDLDGDGDQDILSASQNDNTIAWYMNDGVGTFTAMEISTVSGGAIDVVTADLNGDGYLDIISADASDNTIHWYENDGNQNFSIHEVSIDRTAVRSVFTEDVDGDGDVDILSAVAGDDLVLLHVNDGTGQFTDLVITEAFDQPYAVNAADLDGDDLLDIVVASGIDNSIVWFRNDGNNLFSENVISSETEQGWSLQLVDFDGDEDLDILQASAYSHVINLFENQLDPVGVRPFIVGEQSPEAFQAFRNFPNPFNPWTRIEYAVLVESRVRLVIYDITGREVRSLVNEHQQGGWYEVAWGGKDAHGKQVSAGTYIAKFSAGELSHVIKMVYLR